jgi:hypothetical protein
MDFSMIQMIGIIAGSGAATGGVTVAGIRVHIQYLREMDSRILKKIEGTDRRLQSLERESAISQSMGEHAHSRIDQLKGLQT